MSNNSIAHFRYKTHDETRAERRSYFTEREIPIGGVPTAPPRANKSSKMLQSRKQSVKDFRESSAKRKTSLFQADHQTEEGFDLLPVNRKIAFDCDDEGANARDIFVGITGKNISYFYLNNSHNEGVF